MATIPTLVTVTNCKFYNNTSTSNGVIFEELSSYDGLYKVSFSNCIFEYTKLIILNSAKDMRKYFGLKLTHKDHPN